MGLLIDYVAEKHRKKVTLPENKKKLQPRQIQRFPFQCHFRLSVYGIDPLSVIGGDFTEDRFDKDKQNSENTYVYFATTVDIDEIKIRIRENGNLDGYRFFLDWRRNMTNADGTLKMPVEYWKEIVMERLDPDMHVLYALTYSGCWITSIGDHTPDHSQKEFVTYDITFSVNTVKASKLLVPLMKPRYGGTTPMPDPTKLAT